MCEVPSLVGSISDATISGNSIVVVIFRTQWRKGTEIRRWNQE